jgi:uncharacterized membrane protein YhaH (DUF805 family)
VTLVDSIRTCFQKYVDFSGRASRPEFWWFFLFTVIAQAVLGVFLPGVAFLVLLLPTLAATARRLHDTGRSAWWLMSYLAAGMGTIIMAVAALILALEGDEFFGLYEIEGADLAAIVVLFLVGLAAGAIGSLLPLILCALPGTIGSNRYGDDPLAHQPEAGTAKSPADEPEGPSATVKPEPEWPQFCAQCGSGLEPDAKFCANCGTAV